MNTFKNMKRKHKKIEVVVQNKSSSIESIILEAIQEPKNIEKGCSFIMMNYSYVIQKSFIEYGCNKILNKLSINERNLLS